MNTNALRSLPAVLLGIAAFVAHNAGAFTHEATLIGAKNTTEAAAIIDDLRNGKYLENQAVGLFCSASASLHTEGELPDEATSWRDFVAARAGVTTDSEDYFEGKLAQLETAVDLGQRNPRAALRYVKACGLR